MRVSSSARLVSLVQSGRLADRKVAIVAGDDATGVEFRRAAQFALASAKIRPVALARADAVLVPTLDVSALPLLEASTAAARHGRALDVYGVDRARVGTRGARPSGPGRRGEAAALREPLRVLADH